MKLLVLHGFSQNGAVLCKHLAPLTAQLDPRLHYAFPNAPHACSDASITRLRPMLGPGVEAPYLCWWNATDDGQLYRGWEESLSLLRSHVSSDEPFGLLGFSQGAIAAAVLTALAERAQLALPRFVVLVAGRIPRASALKPLFAPQLSTPSLHVWGERDVMAAAHAPELAETFIPESRQLVRWDGPHVLPTFGPGADAIVSFVRKHSCV